MAYRTDQQIIDDLKHEENLRIMDEIISEAEERGKWIMSRYQRLIFTPDQLRALNKEGRFVWANKDNWAIVEPETGEYC